MQEFDEKINLATDAENKADFLGATLHLKSALEIARTNNMSSEIVSLKSRITELSKKINFQSFESRVDIPVTEINKAVADILGDEPDTIAILNRIGHHPALFPKVDKVREQARSSTPIFFQLASLSTFSQDGHLIKGGSNAGSAWSAKMYSIEQNLISGIYLQQAFSILKEKNGLTSDILIAYLEGKNIFQDRNLELLKRGIDRYFEGDYTSALHILVPQFESVFLYFSEKAGIDIIALERGEDISTRNKVLSENDLTKQNFIDVWSKDFCEQIRFTLFDPLGYKLRHKIAHGDITPEECTQINTELILYFFLVLAARVQIKLISQ